MVSTQTKGALKISLDLRALERAGIATDEQLCTHALEQVNNELRRVSSAG
jgi:hypothetical protein